MPLPDFLAAGYRQFRSNAFPRSVDRYRKLAIEGQQPGALVIACCDSRSAPEAIFNSGPGEVFVLRNVANIVPPYEPDAHLHGTSAAIEYAVDVLDVGDVVVLGHAGCGGIQAALAGQSTARPETAFIGNWVAMIADLAKQVRKDCAPGPRQNTMLERLSIEKSLSNLRSFPFVSEREQDGRLCLHGAWFDILEGTLGCWTGPNGEPVVDPAIW
jgi:carbonic anhydrase